MENSKIKELLSLIKEKRLIFSLVLSAALMFASTFFYPLIYLAAAVLVVSVIFLKFNDIFCLLIFSAVFGAFLVPFIAATIAGFAAMAVKYIIDVRKKRAEFLAVPFFVTTAICVLFSLIFYEVDSLGLYQGLMIIGLLYLIYFVVVYRQQIRIRKMFNYMFLGLVCSIVISAIVYILPDVCKTLSFVDEQTYAMASLKDKIAFLDTNGYVRITLLTFHVNHLAAFCLFAMAYSSIKVLTKKERPLKERIYYIIMYVVNLVVGLLTLSKAFIIVFAFEVCVTVVYYIATHKKQALKIIGILFAIFVFFCIVFRKSFIDIFERFFVYNYDTLLGMITTGRSGIWQQYANAVLESPLKLLFGFGLFSKEQLLIGPHNFYIFILYRFGIIGILLLAYLIYSYFVAVKRKPKLSIKHSLIFLTFLVIGLQEACIDERFYFFIIGIALVFLRDDPAPKNELLIENKEKVKK